MLTSYEVFKYIILNMFRVLCNKASVHAKHNFSNISIIFQGTRDVFLETRPGKVLSFAWSKVKSTKIRSSNVVEDIIIPRPSKQSSSKKPNEYNNQP